MITLLHDGYFSCEILSNRLHLLYWKKILQRFFLRLTFHHLYRLYSLFFYRRFHQMRCLLYIRLQMKFFHQMLNPSFVKLPKLFFRRRSLELSCRRLMKMMRILLALSICLHNQKIEFLLPRFSVGHRHRCYLAQVVSTTPPPNPHYKSFYYFLFNIDLID